MSTPKERERNILKFETPSKGASTSLIPVPVSPAESAASPYTPRDDYVWDSTPSKYATPLSPPSTGAEREDVAPESPSEQVSMRRTSGQNKAERENYFSRKPVIKYTIRTSGTVGNPTPNLIQCPDTTSRDLVSDSPTDGSKLRDSEDDSYKVPPDLKSGLDKSQAITIEDKPILSELLENVIPYTILRRVSNPRGKKCVALIRTDPKQPRKYRKRCENKAQGSIEDTLEALKALSEDTSPGNYKAILNQWETIIQSAMCKRHENLVALSKGMESLETLVDVLGPTEGHESGHQTHTANKATGSQPEKKDGKRDDLGTDYSTAVKVERLLLTPRPKSEQARKSSGLEEEVPIKSESHGAVPARKRSGRGNEVSIKHEPHDDEMSKHSDPPQHKHKGSYVLSDADFKEGQGNSIKIENQASRKDMGPSKETPPNMAQNFDVSARSRKITKTFMTQVITPPTLEFEEWQPLKTLYDSAQLAVLKMAVTNLPPKKGTAEGYIYPLYTESHSGKIKIGLTEHHPRKRLEQLNTKCKIELRFQKTFFEKTFFDTIRKIPHVYRAEELIHTELKASRLKLKCNCSTKHDEWFKVEEAYALMVIHKWEEWMLTKPYGDNGKGTWILKPESFRTLFAALTV